MQTALDESEASAANITRTMTKKAKFLGPSDRGFCIDSEFWKSCIGEGSSRRIDEDTLACFTVKNVKATGPEALKELQKFKVSKLLTFAGPHMVKRVGNVVEWMEELEAGRSPKLEKAPKTNFVAKVAAKMSLLAEFKMPGSSGSSGKTLVGVEAVEHVFETLKELKKGNETIPLVDAMWVNKFSWLLKDGERTMAMALQNQAMAESKTGMAVVAGAKRKVKNSTVSAKDLVANLFA